MANVIFKRGYLASLPTTAEDGVFYLTQDTNRLYIGQGTTMSLLNQTVNIIASLSALETMSDEWTALQKADHVNDFYYLTAENILAVWKYDTEKSQYRWVQINPDTNTFIQSATATAAVSGNIGTITTSLNDNDSHEISSNFKLEGANGITIAAATATGATPGLLISGKEYTLGRGNVTTSEANVVLSNTKDSTTSGFALYAGNSKVSFSSTGTNAIVIDTDDDYVESASLSITTATGAINLELTRAQGGTVTATLSNIGIVLHDGTYMALNNTTDTSGVKSSSKIYSKAEIDSLINGLDGMTYKGIVDNSGNSLPTSNVKNGDLYVVAANNFMPSTATYYIAQGEVPASGAIVGDMFIASGVETDGVISGQVQWTYIPSGNDSLDSVTYTPEITTATNSILIKDGGDAYRFGMQLTAATGISIVSAEGANNQIISTISHALYSTTATTTASNSLTSFTAITGLTYDNGHVTGIETETFTPIGYKFGDTLSSNTANSVITNGTRMSNVTNSGANDLTIGVNLATEDDTPVSSLLIKFSSNTIKLAAGNSGEVTMNMEWGTF